MNKTLLILVCFLVHIAGFSQVEKPNSNQLNTQSYVLKNGDTLIYKKAKLFDFILKTPRNVIGTVVDASETNNLIYLSSATAATFVLVNNDQDIILEARRFGERLNMEEVARYENFGPLSNIPPNITSAIYLIGNGTTPVLLSLGFTTYGLITNDYRSLNTASGLMQSLVTSGVFSQTIKRITGRQSPVAAFDSGVDGGEWNLFPSFKAYAENTPNFDAFPSGHLMTGTSALYVIAGNYPDVKWIKPVGLTLLTVMSFQMAQSFVHWVSDYPVAFVMGYIIGKNIVKNSFTKVSGNGELRKTKTAFNFSASRINNYNLIGVNMRF